ncbi:MAG: type I pullulanase [Erysipelotrichaceae bacterium]
MRKKTNFEAYLDDFHKINAYISTSFYNGKSAAFYLRMPNGELKDLKITSQMNVNDQYVKYVLAVEQPLEIYEQYEIIEEHALSTTLAFGLIVKSPEFDRDFAYLGDDLGCEYRKDQTSFKLWAPMASQVLLQIEQHGKMSNHQLTRGNQGVYHIAIEGDLDEASYVYLVKVNGKWREVTDPYSDSLNANGKQSVVINWERCDVDLHHDALPIFEQKTDAVIYEASVRDFSSMLEGVEHVGKYLGVVESGVTLEDKPVLMDHLLKMGITHLQLQPVHDFATIDELNISKFYNWGYDPVSYYTLEGSYSSNPEDGYTRILEFKTMVSKLHQKGIRVVLDLVYNHYYDYRTNSLQSIVPNYFFQMDQEANLSNGSYCGNDFDSSRAMGRKYIVDSCVNWVKTFGIDGIRFDLMGIMDIETVNLLLEECRKFKPDFMVYGEGWNMPTMLEQRNQATMTNYPLMPEIGFFNDFYRDHVKGSTSEDEVYKKGYATGDASLFEAMKTSLSGTCSSVFGEVKFLNPTQSVNYVECHDNATLWDKMRECCKEEVREVRMKRQMLVNGVVLLSQGIPFLHSGQEFARTKYGVHNSYRSNDQINALDWERCMRNYDVVSYTADMISIRKKYPCLRLITREQVEELVSIQELQPGVVHYAIKNTDPSLQYKALEVVINTTHDVVYHDFGESVQMVANEAGCLPIRLGTKCPAINPLTIIVVERI